MTADELALYLYAEALRWYALSRQDRPDAAELFALGETFQFRGSTHWAAAYLARRRAA
jgi:hypothetical protein